VYGALQNRFTGPYIRLHANLTEIDEGLALLRRADVSALNVVFGLGFYGHSWPIGALSGANDANTTGEWIRHPENQHQLRSDLLYVATAPNIGAAKYGVSHIVC
jgi:hypothetical protein